jgi:AbrB family looped-hinge helix DNA binding protein
MTLNKSSQVRVKRKGQVTIPLEFRSKLGIEEGALLEIKEEGAIVLKPTPRLETGKVVGEEEYKQIISELDQLRRKWR